jgi:hypothetical protein
MPARSNNLVRLVTRKGFIWQERGQGFREAGPLALSPCLPIAGYHRRSSHHRWSLWFRSRPSSHHSSGSQTMT